MWLFQHLCKVIVKIFYLCSRKEGCDLLFMVKKGKMVDSMYERNSLLACCCVD